MLKLQLLYKETVLKELLKDERAGVRRGALLALLQEDALPEAEIEPFVGDADAAKLGVAPPKGVAATIQERAYSSPIWYAPPTK